MNRRPLHDAYATDPQRCQTPTLTRRRALQCGAAAMAAAGWPVLAHHGWSSFDQDRPLVLHGRAVEVKWRNPHAELVLERTMNGLPPNLSGRTLPAQVAPVNGPALLARAAAPQRPDARWMVELAPLTRMGLWKIPEITVGTELTVLGFTFAGEKGEAVLRAEFLFLGAQAYGLRSSPA